MEATTASQLATGGQALSAIGGTVANINKTRAEAATLKAQRLKEYRHTLATNTANAAASGFTTDGDFQHIDNANQKTLESDFDTIESQAKVQSIYSAVGGLTTMASAFGDLQNKSDEVELARSVIPTGAKKTK